MLLRLQRHRSPGSTGEAQVAWVALGHRSVEGSPWHGHRALEEPNKRVRVTSVCKRLFCRPISCLHNTRVQAPGASATALCPRGGGPGPGPAVDGEMGQGPRGVAAGPRHLPAPVGPDWALRPGSFAHVLGTADSPTCLRSWPGVFSACWVPCHPQGLAPSPLSRDHPLLLPPPPLQPPGPPCIPRCRPLCSPGTATC